jgi:hypothetical protein
MHSVAVMQFHTKTFRWYQHSQSPHAGTCSLTHLINKGSDEGHMCIAFPKGEGCTCRYFLGGWCFPNMSLRIQCKITHRYQIPGSFTFTCRLRAAKVYTQTFPPWASVFSCQVYCVNVLSVCFQKYAHNVPVMILL